MANALTWEQTYSLAKSQGLNDIDAAKSANKWAQQGGGRLDTASGYADNSGSINPVSTNQYTAPRSWTSDQATAITGQTNPVSSSSAPLSIIPASNVASAAPAGTTPNVQASIIPATTLQAPTYTPYVAQEFDDTVSDGPRSDLGWKWVKGPEWKQLWNQEQAQAADENYKGYTSQYNQYLQNYNQQQDAFKNQASLLPYTQMTAAQEADYGLSQASAKVKSNELAYTQAYNRWNTAGYVLPGDEEVLGVPAGTPTNDASYRESTLALQTAKSSGSGGGGVTSYQQYQINRNTNKDEAESQAAMDKWVTNMVANDGRLNPDYSNYATLYDAWKNMYVQNMYGG